MQVGNDDSQWLATIAGNEPDWNAPSEAGESRRMMLANLDDLDFNAPERAHRLDYIVSIVFCTSNVGCK
jgi:hypothetical protein